MLSARASNRALLARQGLLERRTLSLPDALDAMGGLQAQYAPSIYFGLWSRVADLSRAAVTAALEDRSVVQGTLMRSTIHVVSRADYWPLALAVRDARRSWWMRAAKAEPYDAEAAMVRDALRGGATMRRTELEALIGKEAMRAINLWVDLVRVPPSGTWERRRADLFGLAEDWVAPVAVDDPVGHLVRRYLTGFGPAALADIASWTGLPARELPVAGLERLEAEDGTELFDLPGMPLPDPETPAPVRFLPWWDAALLVHARRTLLLPEEFRPRIFHTKNPQSVGTFLVDGVVAGAWRLRKDGLEVEEFTLLDRAQRRAVEQELERMAEFAR